MKNEDYMKELDQLKAAGELDNDEPAFHGHTLDLTKWEAYQNIKAALEELMEKSQFIQAVRGHSTPYPAEQDGTVSVTISRLAAFTEKETAVLADTMTKADRFSFTAMENSVFFNFTVGGIWLD